jgi:hypothetical protein
MFILILSLIRLGFTSFYSIRFSISTMWGPTLIRPWVSIKEESKIIYPILTLSFMSIIAGGFIRWFQPVSSTIFILPTHLKLMPLILVTAGALTAFYMSSLKSTNLFIPEFFTITYYASCNIWFLVPLSSQFILKTPLILRTIIYKHLDQGWLEISSGQNINKKLFQLSSSIISNSPKIPTAYLLTPIIISLIYLIIN